MFTNARLISADGIRGFSVQDATIVVRDGKVSEIGPPASVKAPAGSAVSSDRSGDKVDAALVGLDRRELVTIPSLPESADWEAYTAARVYLGPNLSRQHAADRYIIVDHAAAGVQP